MLFRSVGATGVAYESITVNDYVVVAGGQSTLTTTNSRADSTTAFTASGGTVAGSGGVGSYTFSISPAVSGITINSSTGVVTVSNGTASGTYNEVVTATDYVGATGTKSITIVVNAKPIIGGGIGVNAGGGTYTETFNNQGLSVAGLTVVVNGSNVIANSGQATGGSANYLCSYNNMYGTSGCSLGINSPASLVITFPTDSQPTSFSFIGSAVNSPQPLNVV